MPARKEFDDPSEFWCRADQTGGPDACWIWLGGLTRSGYGQAKWAINGVRRPFKAHQIAFAVTAGCLPRGQVIRHSCDNPRCVNPVHLVLGSQAENMADMVRRGRSAKGEGHSQAKLTEQQVIEIRRLRTLGYSQRVIGVMFGVSRSAISDIASGKNWRHLLEAA
jgi:hypothetical protein